MLDVAARCCFSQHDWLLRWQSRSLSLAGISGPPECQATIPLLARMPSNLTSRDRDFQMLQYEFIELSNLQHQNFAQMDLGESAYF
jgi:hypothetical protein